MFLVVVETQRVKGDLFASRISFQTNQTAHKRVSGFWSASRPHPSGGADGRGSTTGALISIVGLRPVELLGSFGLAAGAASTNSRHRCP